MRILLLAVLLFVTFHFIRLDLVEGTIPLASFTHEQQQSCEEQQMTSIPVTTVDGDTIESLFALYPDPESGFIDRLVFLLFIESTSSKPKDYRRRKNHVPLSHIQTEKCIESNCDKGCPLSFCYDRLLK